MVLHAYKQAGCAPQLGPSESFVDWSVYAPPTVPCAPTPTPASTDDPERAAIVSSCVQTLMVMAMLLVSVMVGALGGAVSSVSQSDVAQAAVEARFAALVERVEPARVALTPLQEAEIAQTLAAAEARLGAVSVQPSLW